jgi:hypothetical protein
MHTTLTTRTNVLLIGTWGALAAAAVLLTRPRPLVVLLAAVAFGVAVGLLQWRSMAQAGALFRQASTAMDVRRALLSTPAGKWAIGLQWTGAAVLVAAAIWEGSAIGGVIGGYAAFMAVREIATLRAVMQLGTATA